ncbi:uncharacterized protein LOC5519388 isoform X2 [Nematostella vectensis]|uniref:uncharacterized protein LOC5519388 isoform X2 n=1 Tax=Nematostella vectensis TaxID=45351 RepID=UPI002076F83A|nr:uncharacterized protein LOC5519388 isoform X2 [Nematostella vectensis]
MASGLTLGVLCFAGFLINLCYTTSIYFPHALHVPHASYVINNGLTQNGQHVCEASVSRTVTHSIKVQTQKYTTTYTRCGLFLWWRCKRVKPITRTYYKVATKTEYGVSLHCCDGWSKTGSDCRTPWCGQGCNHGGICKGGHVCSCTSGWQGNSCSDDVDECSNTPCQQICSNIPGSYACGCYKGYQKNPNYHSKCDDFDECAMSPCRCANQNNFGCNATCINTAGSFVCKCSKGYTLIRGTICQDIDECLSTSTNTCPGRCINRLGSYTCDCPRGYTFDNSSRRCIDINECERNNGWCEHDCINILGTYRCRCRDGYKLDPNRRTCQDLDECALFNGCEAICNNTQGSYHCACLNGYQLNSDGLTCSDLDECSIQHVSGLRGNASLADCEQVCVNVIGSFTCACKRGFILRHDGKTCEDIDECDTGLHKCEHQCNNTFGSYSCSCSPGFALADDKKSCKGLPCVSIEAPSHGSMKCSGHVTGANCSFYCSAGYEIAGSASRQCLSNSQWSGARATCNAMSCQILRPSPHTFVTMPCPRSLGSLCNFECEDGYYVEGAANATCSVDDITGGVKWRTSSFTCTESTSCHPNPCLHGGTCVTSGLAEQRCECEETGYEGKLCEKGRLRIPVFPKLEVNKQSRVLHVSSPPVRELRINMSSPSGDLNILPNVTVITSKALDANFTVTARRPGLHVISYHVTGSDSDSFTTPDDSLVYVNPDMSSNLSVYDVTHTNKRSFPIGCHQLQESAFVCNAQAKLVATAEWKMDDDTGHYVTQGIVHMRTHNTSVPVSLTGFDLGNLARKSKEHITYIRDMPKSLPDTLTLRHHDNCTKVPMKPEYLMQLISDDVLPLHYLGSVSQALPAWLNLEMDTNTGFDVRNLMIDVNHATGVCSGLPLATAATYYRPRVGFKVQVDDENARFTAKDGVCFAHDVCKGGAFVKFAKDSQEKLSGLDILRQMESVGWKTRLAAIGVTRSAMTSQQSLFVKAAVNAQLQSNDGKALRVTMETEGDWMVTSGCFDKLLNRRFSCPINGTMTGKTTLTASMQIAGASPGNRSVIKITGNNVTGSFSLGGKTTNKISKQCERIKGFKFVLKATENPFKTAAELRDSVIPYVNLPVSVDLQYDITGGERTGLIGTSDARTKIGGLKGQIEFWFKMILTTVSGMILPSAPQLRSNYGEWINTYTSVLQCVTNASTIVNSYSGLESQIDGVISSIKKMQIGISNLLELSAEMRRELSRIPIAMGIINQLNAFDQIVNASRTIGITLVRSPVRQRLTGLVLNLTAQVCRARLCLRGVEASVDFNTGSCDLSDSFIPHHRKPNCSAWVLGQVKDELTLSHVITMTPGDRLYVNSISGAARIQGTVRMLGIQQSALIDISPSGTLSFSIKGRLDGQFQCTLDARANADVGDWPALLYHVSGRLDDQSELVQRLQDDVNSYVESMREKAQKRLNGSEQALASAQQRMLVIENLHRDRTADIKRVKRWRRLNETELLRIRDKYSQAKEDFNQALAGYNHTRSSLYSCELSKCGYVCNKTCVPDICWSPVVISYVKQNCHAKDIKINVTRPKQMSEKREYYTQTKIKIISESCKSWEAAFSEGLFWPFYQPIGRKRRSSETPGNDKETRIVHARDIGHSISRSPRSVNKRSTSEHKDINEILKRQVPALDKKFDINYILRKNIANISKTFDLTRALHEYTRVLDTFNVNHVMRKAFPGLREDYDVNRDLMEAIPALKISFDLDALLRDSVQRCRHTGRPVRVDDALKSAFPERRVTSIDKIISQRFPALRMSISYLINQHLHDMSSFSLDQLALRNFDVSKVVGQALGGLDSSLDINARLKKNLRGLGPDFDLSHEIMSRVTRPRDIDRLDVMQVIKDKTAQAHEMCFENLTRLLIPKVAQGFDLEQLIKTGLRKAVHVTINESMLANLSVDSILRKAVPIKLNVTINQIILEAHPELSTPLDLTELLKGSVPLLKMFGGSIDINSLIKGSSPKWYDLSLDIDKSLKARNPALRGSLSISSLLSNAIRHAVTPGVDDVVCHAITQAVDKSLSIQRVIESKVPLLTKQKLDEAIFIALERFRDDKTQKDLKGLSARKRNKRFLFSVISGIINGFASSGCKQSTHEWDGPTKKLSYTRLFSIMEVIQEAAKVFVCKNGSTVNQKTKGFENPTPCCREDIKCVKFLEPECVVENEACIKWQKNKFEREWKQMNGSLFLEYIELTKQSSAVDQKVVELDNLKLQEKMLSTELTILEAKRRQTRAQMKTMKTSLARMQQIPDVRTGLRLGKLTQSSPGLPPVRVHSMSFDLTTGIGTSRRFLANVQLQTSKRNSSGNFVLELDALNSSISIATPIIIREALGETRRKRSLVDTPEANEDKAQHQVPDAEKCQFALNASLFFFEVINSLSSVVNSTLEIEKGLETEFESFDSLHTYLESTNSSAVKAYQDMMSQYKDQRLEHAQLLSWNETFAMWKAYTEMLTEARGFKACAGTADCITAVASELMEIYSMYNNDKDVNKVISLIPEVERGLGSIITSNMSLSDVRETLGQLEVLLNSSMDSRLICADKPRLFNQTISRWTVEEGEHVVLGCEAQSVTKVIYTWRRGDEVVQKADHGTLELPSIKRSEAGMYTCEAANHKGSAEYHYEIIIEYKPELLEEPISFKLALYGGKGATFSCLATGNPQPRVEWYYRPLYSKLSFKLPDNDSRLVYIEPDDVMRSGFYYCVASNSRGRVVSEEGRLDILRSRGAVPRMAVVFNVTACAQDEECNHTLPSKLGAADIHTLKSNISSTTGVLTTQVNNLKFARITDQRASIFFALTGQEAEGDAESAEEILTSFSMQRLNLVERVQRLRRRMSNGSFTQDMKSLGLRPLPDTLLVFHGQPLCEHGWFLHKNGFLCGTYQNKSGQEACNQCPPGTYGKSDGMCTLCPTNTYQNKSGQASCIYCPNGTHQNQSGQEGCVECPPGSYWKPDGMCALCQKGTYQNQSGQTTCIQCAAGLVTQNTGTTHMNGCIATGAKPPPAPLGLITTVISPSSVNLIWFSSSAAKVTHYNIKYISSILSGQLTVSANGFGYQTYMLKGLTGLTYYTVQLYSVNSGVVGGYISKSFKTPEGVPGAAPVITATAPVNPTAVNVTWRRVPPRYQNGNIRGYMVYYKKSTESQYHSKTVNDANCLSTVLAGLGTGSDYCIKITAFTSVGPFGGWDQVQCTMVQPM